MAQPVHPTCNVCGAGLRLQSSASTVACDYCGSEHIIPNVAPSERAAVSTTGRWDYDWVMSVATGRLEPRMVTRHGVLEPVLIWRERPPDRSPESQRRHMLDATKRRLQSLENAELGISAVLALLTGMVVAIPAIPIGAAVDGPVPLAYGGAMALSTLCMFVFLCIRRSRKRASEAHQAEVHEVKERIARLKRASR